MKKLTILLSILLLVPTLTLAITWPNRSIIDDIKNAIAGNGVWPYDTLQNIFFFVFIPFWGVFAVTFGILTNLNIFHLKRVNILLSILFAMSLLYYGVLLWLVSLIYTLTGLFATVAFFVIFAVGVFLFGKRKEAGWREQAESAAGLSKDISQARKQLKETQEELKMVREDLTDAASPRRIKQLKEREQSLLKTIKELRQNIVGMKTKGESLRSDLITGGD